MTLSEVLTNYRIFIQLEKTFLTPISFKESWQNQVLDPLKRLSARSSNEISGVEHDDTKVLGKEQMFYSAMEQRNCLRNLESFW